MMCSVINHRKAVSAVLLTFAVLGLTVGCQTAGRAAGGDTPTCEPIRVTDDIGGVFEFEDPPERIAALSSFSLEMLMALGHTPVARFDAPSQYPPESQAVSVIGRSYQTGPDIDHLKAQQPDLVVLHPIYAKFAASVEEAVGAPAMVLNVKSVDEVRQKLELFGRLVGKPDAAEAMIAELELTRRRIADQTSAIAGRPVAVSLLGREDRWYAHRGDHFMGSLLSDVGAENAATNDKADKRYRSLAPIDLGQLVEKDPDVIFLIPYGEDDAKIIVDNFNNDPATQSLKAVKNSRVHILPDTIFTRQPGPRTDKALKTLYRHLYPDAAPLGK